MNKKTTLLILINTVFLLLTINIHYKIENKKNSLMELKSLSSELISTINKNGLMKNCNLFETSKPLINPHIFKNSGVKSINITIKNNEKYEFCYSKENSVNLPYIGTNFSYNEKLKNDYIFLKEVKIKKDCSNFIKLTNNYFYCLKGDYIIHYAN